MKVSEDKLQEWREAKKCLDEAKKLEMELRKEITIDVFGGSQTKAREKIEIDGVQYTFENNTNFKLDENEFDAMVDLGHLNQMEKDCVVYKPSLSKTNMNKLSTDSVFFNCVMEVPAAPTIKIKEI